MAHPRSRGENDEGYCWHNQKTGSSPLTRGKPIHVPRSSREGGLIPAHAGKTAWPPSFWSIFRAHPRSRGENVRATRLCRKKHGSSPLTRGKLPVAGEDALDHGLIPAHAGKTWGGAAFGSHRRAHPRSRGENISQPYYLTGETGSSPLTRGKLGAGRRSGHTVGLIPAHAGKTSPSPTT